MKFFVLYFKENAQENVRRLTENGSYNLPHLKECCPTKKSNHCHCPSCGIEYCCVECRQSAYDTYHQALCLGENRTNENHMYNLLMDAWRSTHLPPETTTINLIVKMIATVKQVD